jgi:hypothetical protein
VKTKSVGFDFGTDNQAIFAEVGVFATKEDENVLVVNPADSTEYLVFLVDPPHTTKNVHFCGLKYRIRVPQWWLESHGLGDLRGVLVDVEHWVTKLIDIQDTQGLQLVPGLNRNHIRPSASWEKMRMGTTLMIINSRVVVAILVCVERGEFFY